MRWVLYIPEMKDLRCVVEKINNNPATWQLYKDVVGGKEKILDMEIREYRESKEKAEEGKLGVKEKYKALIHIAAAAVDAAYALREENHGRI